MFIWFVFNRKRSPLAVGDLDSMKDKPCKSGSIWTHPKNSSDYTTKKVTSKHKRISADWRAGSRSGHPALHQ